jgi:GR25 family glycosyltransferase involved in LPS biosynthesis
VKTYIIHLGQVPASLASAKRLQQELQDFGQAAELFEGSYGDQAKEQYKITNRHCHPWGLKGPEQPFSDEYKQELSTPGIIGCFDSHYRLWKHCVELGESIMIFEDDAHVIRPYIPVDWVDVLVVASSHTKKMGKYQHLIDNPTADLPHALLYSQSTLPGAAGYAIHPHAAEKLAKSYQKSFLPADNAVNQYIVNIQIHSHMIGYAIDREKTDGKSSLIRTRYWNK